MITLAMDTAYRYLSLALYRDDVLLAGFSEDAFKKQSERIFVELNTLLKEAHLSYKDIDEIVITQGPGSYTGLRIAMTVAKVLSTRLNIPLYVISTMQLYTGLKDGVVLLDARAKRAFFGRIEKGVVKELGIYPLEEIEKIIGDEDLFYGDASLIGRKAQPSRFLDNFIELRSLWEPVENVHALKPLYLKEFNAS